MGKLLAKVKFIPKILYQLTPNQVPFPFILNTLLDTFI